MTQHTGRVGLLDEVRGLCILLMVVYHAAYDLVALFGVNIPAFHSPLLGFLQPFVAGIFIFISGIACRYSRSNLRRGGIALGLGLGLTLVTFLAMRDQAILFGILHFMGAAMLLFGILHNRLDRLSPQRGMAVCLLLFALLWGLPAGSVLFGLLPLPRALYTTRFLFFLGFPQPGFASADYFPLLPWLPLFFAGAYTGCFFRQGRLPAGFYRTHIPFLAKTGRYTIFIYLAHQPVVYGVLWVFFRLTRS